MKRKKKNNSAVWNTGRPVWTKIASGLAVFVCLAAVVYAFSPCTRIQALICSGNYYYSPQQVFKLADIGVNSRIFMHPTSQIEKKLAENPLIESASVTKDGQNVNIAIQEKNIIGYYEKEGSNYLVTSERDRIPVENETELRTLVHFPLLADLSEDTINEIADQVAQKPEYLTRQVFEKIAEILPWSESYDKNMLKLVLQDGNTVFTSIPSLFMMSTYQQVLTDLQGQNVCLLLDGDNQVVNKIACDYMYLSPEQRAGNREIPKSVLTEMYTPEQLAEEQRKIQQQQEEEQKRLEEEEKKKQAPQPQDATDWEPSAVYYMEYSPSTGVFRNTADGQFYTYDAASNTFLPFQ